MIESQRYNRLRCLLPQPPKLYRLPRLHTPNVPMRPIVSFCSSPIYKLSKYLTTILKLLTDESQHKLQSTENFFGAIKTVQVPDNHKPVSFDAKSLFTSIPLQLALDYTKTAINNSTVQLHAATTHQRPCGLALHLSTCTFSTTANTTNGYTEQLWVHQFLLLLKLLCKASRNKPWQVTNSPTKR